MFLYIVQEQEACRLLIEKKAFEQLLVDRSTASNEAARVKLVWMTLPLTSQFQLVQF